LVDGIVSDISESLRNVVAKRTRSSPALILRLIYDQTSQRIPCPAARHSANDNPGARISEELSHAVETDFRERGPIRFAIPEIHTRDDASISGQINNTCRSTLRNVAAHLNFASRSISIPDDDAHEIHCAPANSKLYCSKCAWLLA